MQTYLDGQALSLAIPLLDEDGACYVATAAQYRIVNQSDIELVARVGLSGFTSGDAQAVISVSGAVNTLSGATRRELRAIEIFLTTSLGEVRTTYEYIVEANSVLAVGINSFQTYNEAMLTGFEMPNLPAWADASKQDRISAMTGAWRNIGLLHLRYFSEFNDMSRIVYITTESGNLTTLTADQFASLPEIMKSAVYRAQVIEADYVLGSSESSEMRQLGILSNKVGESMQVYRPLLPYEGPICKRAMKELGRYIVHGKRIGRSS